MLALLALVPDWVKLPAAMVVGGALVFYPARWLGQSEGQQAAAIAYLTKSVEVLRERNAIDGEVSSSDAARLCGALGLPDQDRLECMRRVEQASAQP